MLKDAIKYFFAVTICITILIGTLDTILGQQVQIPSWIKNNAGWWSTGQISDDEFVKGIQYMVSTGIIELKS